MRILPLTKAQQRILLESQFNPNSPAYNNPLLYRLCGNLDVEKLQQALQCIVDSQPALRCYFIEEDGIPKQILLDQLKVTLDYHDLIEYVPDEQVTQITKIKYENVGKSFTISELPLFRFSLIRVAQQEYLFILNIHHIVVDGYSAHLLLKSISKFYNDAIVPPAQDEVYINHLNQPTASLSTDFWINEFKEANYSIDLFTKQQVSELSASGLREHFKITSELTQQIKQLARQNKTTEFIVLMAAFYLVLAKYSNQYDLIIGYAVDTRGNDCKNLFGFFVNNVPLRILFSSSRSFQELLQALTQKRKTIKPHLQTDYLDIVHALRKHDTSAPTSLFDVSFIRANFALSGLTLKDITVHALPIYTNAIKDDLCLLYDESSTFEFEIEYREDKYTSHYIHLLKQSFIQCLQLITKNPQQLIAKINIFPSTGYIAQKQKPMQSKEYIIERFIQHVQANPQQIAVRSSNGSLTYQMLYDKTLKLTSYFYDLQLPAEKPVIICIDRSPEMLSALLALQWLGLAYIPLDISTPVARINQIAHESESSAIIVNEPLEVNCRNILLTPNKEGKDIPTPTKGQLAYIIYTSGSTGTPKGVVISNDALHHFLHCMHLQFKLQSSDCLLAITTIAFDISVLELLLPIWCGSTVYIANQTEYKDPFLIKKLLAESNITYLQATPAMWSMLIAAEWYGNSNLIALCGGESLSQTLARDLTKRVKSLWNMYGPTEATVWCAVKNISQSESITIGNPIANMSFYIMDEAQTILPAYVKGELCIGGPGLAEGYYKRDDLTDAQFYYHPILKTRLYRTGDIACETGDGEFILFGRKDNQIKLNGYRIELGEIEAQILQIPFVKQVAVLVKKQQLIAFVCLNEGTINELSQKMKAILPEYMLPAKYIVLEQLPLSNSGKINRKLLSSTEINLTAIIKKPVTVLEKKLHAIWCDVLKKTAINITDHFYHLGGHSLLALQIIARLQRLHQITLTMSEFFNYPSIDTATKFLETRERITSVIPKYASDHYLLSKAQQRFWFLHRLLGTNSQFNMSGYLELKGDFNIQQLKMALRKVMQVHHSLRSIIFLIDDEPRQKSIDGQPLPLIFLQKNTTQDAFNYLSDWSNTPFDLYNRLLWRAALIHINSESYLLAFTFHHIICDGHSVQIFLRNLWQAYSGEEIALSNNISYYDYAHWEDQQIIAPQQVQYWQQLLSETLYLQLPADKLIEQSTSGKQHTWQLSSADWFAINEFCQRETISISTYLVACFALLLQRLTGLNHFCIGLPQVARPQPELDPIIGCFMNLIPLKIIVPQQLILKVWLTELQNYIQECNLNALPFTSLLEQLKVERHNHQMPLFSVVLNIQALAGNESVQGIETKLNYLPSQTNKYDLSLDLYLSTHELTGLCEYAAHKFNDTTIHTWCQKYQEILTSLIHRADKMICNDTHIQPIVPKKLAIFNTELFTSLQKKIAFFWREFLSQTNINLHDNYFSLGGHSLLATKLITALSKEFSKQIPLETIFIYPVFSDFCNAIAQITKKNVNAQSILKVGNMIHLTANQQQLALKYLHEPNDSYHLGVMLEWPHQINVERLHTTLHHVLRQHSIYAWHLNQNNESALRAETINVDLSILTTFDKTETFNIAKNFVNTPFDLHQAPLCRFALILQNQQCYLLISLHHLIGDEWSLESLSRAILQFYIDESISEKPSDWFSYIANQKIAQEDKLLYWKNYLTNQLPSLILTTKQTSTLSSRVARAHTHCSAELIAQCHQLSIDYGVSIYIIMLALYFVFLRYFCNENRLLIVNSYDRRNLQNQNIHGYLVNLIPITVNFETIDDFKQLVQYLNQDRISSMQHAQIDFATLLSKGYVETPKIVFNFQHAYELNYQNKNLAWHEIGGDIAKFPFVFHLRMDTQQSMECCIEYSLDDYDENFIENCLATYKNLLKLLPINKNKKINTWNIYHEYNFSPIVSHSSSETLLNKLHHVARSHATKTAIEYNNSRLSYQELWEKVQRLSRAILAWHNKSLHDKIIAVAMQNSDDYIVTILAILRLGAAFLPIDSNYPAHRQAQMIDDAQACFVITDTSVEHSNSINFLDLISSKQTNEIVDATNHLAYVIYTSGTTGRPKAVPIQQRQLHLFIASLTKRLAINERDKVLQFASISFDASIWEIFLALYTGATLFIPHKTQRAVGMNLQNTIVKNKITHAILTPSVIRTLDPENIGCLRSLASGGETCTADLVSAWAHKVEFYNAYGPTEATICTNLFRFNSNAKANVIGSSLGGASLYVFSESLQPLPVGAIGELIIAGDVVTEGYLNQPQINQEKFFKFAGMHCYRTGDYVRKNHANQFEYFGRKDTQIKLHGLRIELNEIESVIKDIGIQDVACILRENQIIAYVIDTKKIDVSRIKTQLSQLLPQYMVPQNILQISQFPLTNSGKLDYQALPSVVADPQPITLPRNEIEQQLFEIWHKYLPIDTLDVEGNFFTFGGNSLQAMQICADIETQFCIEFSMHTFYAEPSIAKQASFINAIQPFNIESLSADELELLQNELLSEEAVTIL